MTSSFVKSKQIIGAHF